jgi:hypothetical protein
LQKSAREKIRDIIIPVLIAIVLFSSSELHNRFPNQFPTIHRIVFEQLIQVNSTILGFTLVGMLYYLGDFDDKKKDYVKVLFDFVDTLSTSTTETNEIVEILLGAFKKARISKTPIYTGFLNTLSDVKREGTDRVDALKRLEPQVMSLFGIGDLVEWHLKFITVYIGAAVVLSFLVLFMFSNGWYRTVWPLFFLIISLMTSAADYYYSSWKSMRGLSDTIDTTTLVMKRRSDLLGSNKKHQSP